MDAETFAALCRGLFLEPSDFMEQFEVDVDQVIGWAEAGDPPIPVMQWLLELTILAEELYDASLDDLVDEDEDLELEELPLIELARFASAEAYKAARPEEIMPWSSHTGVVSRLAVTLTAMGYPVEVTSIES